jgi:hypothetical protein
MITNRVLLASALLSSAFVLVACGGAAPPAASPAHEHEHGHEHAHEKEHHEHGALPPSVKDLHDVLAPVWHMPKGPERAAKTCEKATVFQEKSLAVQQAAAPDAAKAAEWRASTTDLVAASKALVAECETTERKQLDAVFVEFHERFHRVADKNEHHH